MNCRHSFSSVLFKIPVDLEKKRKKKKLGATEMAQWIETSVAKTDDLSSLPGTHMVEEKN